MAADAPLAGKTALITGGSRGIGAECARALAADGANLVLLARDARAMQRLADEIAQRGVRISTHRCDLANPDVVPQALGALRSMIGDAPDIIVNNAGAFMIAPLEETGTDDLKNALRLNLASPFLIVREFLGAMKKRGGGDIVTIGSVADRTAFAGNALYAATKFGARGLHEVLREETRGTGVRATLVSPGPVDTSIWDPVNPDARPGFTPRARMLQAHAVADAVRWVVTRPPDVNIDELRLSRS